MSDPRETNPSELPKPLTRRRFIRSSASAGAALSAGGLLAACGSSGNSSSGTAASGSTATAPKSGTTSAIGTQLQKILGQPKNILAKGPGKLSIAGQFALTGAGSIYGQLQSGGFKYGAQHVSEWTNGKLVFDTKYYDNKSGIPQAEAAAGRQAGLSGVPVFINSYIFGFGAILPFAKQYKMFCPDPGGGAGPIPGPFAPAPYCYGFRASYPTDVLDGMFKYLREKFPDKKKWATVQPVIAPPYNNAVANYCKKLYTTYNIDHVGEQLAPLGANNYSSTVQKLKQLNPDVIITTSFGTDVAYQAKEIQRQGLNVLNGTVDFNPTLAKLAGPAIKDWYFGFDYLNTVNPPSDWSKFFVTNWEKDNGGALPSFYNAADYVTAFAVARLVDQILGSGGDIKSGDAYVKALEANPAFPHVYGGNGATLGQMIIDPKTHSPKSIPMLLFQSQGTGNVKDITPLATYNVKAADYKVL
jgi:ABC-type branched-subunit amino acid transport system substrate-binding protein